MRISWYAGYTSYSEVKRFYIKTCFLHEWHKEASKAAVYVDRDLVAYTQLANKDICIAIL